VAQEGLRNVARHARASGVDLSCRATGDGVEMTIRDDGVGFDPDEDRQRPSLGLAGMRERVELVGGRIHVRSAPGRGTAVAVWAPLSPQP
jgi:signal transduction histidine kinase